MSGARYEITDAELRSLADKVAAFCTELPPAEQVFLSALLCGGADDAEVRGYTDVHGGGSAPKPVIPGHLARVFGEYLFGALPNEPQNLPVPWKFNDDRV
jgi:hypothetical protein